MDKIFLQSRSCRRVARCFPSLTVWAQRSASCGRMSAATSRYVNCRRDAPWMKRGLHPACTRDAVSCTLFPDSVLQRLHTLYQADPAKYRLLASFVQDEKARGVQADNSGWVLLNPKEGFCPDKQKQRPRNRCTKGLLWLKRAMQFIVEMLRGLSDGARQLTPYDATTAAYDKVLRPYHGMLTFGVFKARR